MYVRRVINELSGHVGVSGIWGLKGVFGMRVSEPYQFTFIAIGWLALAVLSAALFLPWRTEGASILPARRKLSRRACVGAGFAASHTGIGFIAALLYGMGKWNDWWHAPIRDWTRSSSSLPLLASIPRWLVAALAGLAVLAAFTAIGAVVLRFVSRHRQQYWQLERITLGLILASLVLWIVARALDPMWSVRFWRNYRYDPIRTALAMAWTTLMWSWGCRIRLLFLLRRYEQAPEDQSCFACGYDLRGTISAGRKLCPECGAAIERHQERKPVSHTL